MEVNQSLAKENAILRSQYDAMKVQHDSVVHLLRGQKAIHSAKEHELRSRLEELKGRLKKEETERTRLLEQIGSRDEMRRYLEWKLLQGSLSVESGGIEPFEDVAPKSQAELGRIHLIRCQHCIQVQGDGCISYAQSYPRQNGTQEERKEVNDGAEKKAVEECIVHTFGQDGDDFVAHQDESEDDVYESHWSYGGRVSPCSHIELEDSNKENSSPCSAEKARNQDDQAGNQDDGDSTETADPSREWIINPVMKRLDGEIEEASSGPISFGESGCCAAGPEELFHLPMVELERQHVVDSKSSSNSTSLSQIEEAYNGYVTPVRYGFETEAVHGEEALRMSPAGSNETALAVEEALTETRRSSLRARRPIDYTLPSIRSKLRQVSISYYVV